MLQMIWGFLYHNYTEIPRETIRGCMLCCYPAIHYYVSAKLQVALLDCGVGNTEGSCKIFWEKVDGLDDHKRMLLVLILAMIQLVLFLLKWMVSRKHRQLRLGGKAIRMLRTNMFTTMLQLSNEAKDCFDDGDVPKALDTQVEMAIKAVW